MFEKVNNDLVAAMKSGDKFTLSVLRMLKSAIIYEQTNGEKHELTDDDIMSVIKKQVKTRKTSMEEYLSYDRKDLADNLQKEIDILSKYLPEELSDEELTKIMEEFDGGKIYKIIKENTTSRILFKLFKLLQGTTIFIKQI